MIRTCIIGDSHIGSLRQAATDGGFPRSCFELTFFACHVSLIQALRIDDRALVAGSDELRDAWAQFSAGRSSIEIDLYDRFVIIGHGFWIGSMVYLYRSFRSDSMPSAIGEKYLLSDNCIIKTCEQVLLRCEALRIAFMIRSLCDKPIIIVPAPNPSVGLAESEVSSWFPPFYEAERNGDADAIGLLFRKACDQLSSALNVMIMPPLAEVAANGVFNRREFGLLPDDLDADPNLDRMSAMTHANGDYGAILAQHVFALQRDFAG